MPDDEPRARVAFVVGNRVVQVGAIGRDTRCDFLLVDRILRLRLAAARLGWTLHLSAVDEDLRDLLDLVGVADRLVT
jgi:hypothetical protein